MSLIRPPHWHNLVIHTIHYLNKTLLLLNGIELGLHHSTGTESLKTAPYRTCQHLHLQGPPSSQYVADYYVAEAPQKTGALLVHCVCRKLQL